MNDRELIDQLLDGCSLRTLMVPDPALPENAPEHLESYELPHVIVRGELFWAKSATTHLSIADGQPIGNVSFCYANHGDVFCSFAPGYKDGLYFMPKKRYTVHEWRLRKNFKVIWDSDAGESTEIVGEEIARGATFKIALLDSEDVWNLHPVDLPFYYSEANSFEMKTVSDLYPQFFRQPEEFQDSLRNSEGYDSFLTSESAIVRLSVPDFSTFYSVRSDGSYFNYYDVSRSSRQTYQRLKLFSDSI